MNTPGVENTFVSQNVSVPEGNSIGGLLVFTLLGAVAE
jgi:hypothetical protein